MLAYGNPFPTQNEEEDKGAEYKDQVGGGASCAKKMTKHLSGAMATPKNTAAPPSWKKCPESMSSPCSSSRNKISVLLCPTQSHSIGTSSTEQVDLSWVLTWKSGPPGELVITGFSQRGESRIVTSPISARLGMTSPLLKKCTGIFLSGHREIPRS